MSKSMDAINEDDIDELQGSGLNRQCLEWEGQARTITGVVVDLYACVESGRRYIEIQEDEGTRTPVAMSADDARLADLPQLGDVVEAEAVETGEGMVAAEIEVRG